MNNGTTLRRKRSKSAPDATLVEEVDTGERHQGEAPEVPDETPLEQLLPRSRSGSITQTDVVDMVNLEAFDIFLHRTDTGTWVITPLGSEKHRIELRPRSDGLPPPGCKGVIWRLDDQVLNSAYQELQDEDEEFTAEKSSPRAVARRLEKVSSGMKRLGRVTVKLEEKFAHFQEEKLQLEKKQKRLNKSMEDSAKEHAELASMREKFQAEQEKFLEEKTRFDEEVRKNTDELAQSKRALSTGQFAVLPPHVLFLAAQDEFVRALPELKECDQVTYQSMRPQPEAAFASARSLFFNRGTEGAEALVSALLACQCMLEAQAPKVFQNLEQLLGLSQAVARSANVDGRLRLSFAASSCTLWCSLQLSEFLARKWDEVNAFEGAQDLMLEEQDLGLMYKRLKLLSQAGSSLKRAQKSWGEYWDHRRRFIRCLAKPGNGGATEADLRLLFLPFRDVRGTELAAHVRRLSGIVEDLVMESRKRASPVSVSEVEVKRPKPSSRP